MSLLFLALAAGGAAKLIHDTILLLLWAGAVATAYAESQHG